MSLSKNKFLCRCFFTENYFIKSLKKHTNFLDVESFLDQHGQLLREKCSNEDINIIVKELEDELNRRKNLGRASLERRKIIKENYFPLHPHVYCLQEKFLSTEFCDLVKQCNSIDRASISLKPVKGTDRVYQIPIFTHQFCQDLIEELSHFENSAMPKSRPNTMNNYGVNLDELGFDDGFLTPLRERYLSPVAGLLFPDCGGDSLDSHRAFTVAYGSAADTDLDLHFDNGEVTANISLSLDVASDDDGDRGELYFDGMRSSGVGVGLEPSYASCRHRVGYAVLHRSQQLHGALPVAVDSSRCNLIIWMRSSKERNRLCPMCDRPPRLVETEGNGDGFSVEHVDICSLT